MKKLSLTEIQQRELMLLDFFDEFCKEHKLRYYLCGGSLLGAIRHKGFIPWDDDLDVCMPRKDYVKFSEMFRDNKRFVLRSDVNGRFNRPFAKLFDKTVVAKNYNVSNEKRPYLWLDILPVDGLPKDDVELRKVYNEISIYQKILLLSTMKWTCGTSYVRKILKPGYLFFFKVFGAKWARKRINKIVRRYPYDISDHVGVLTAGIYGVGERMEKNKFEREVKVLFEGKEYPAFSCWHEYLQGIYGDYMQIPPIEDRKIHNVDFYAMDVK